MKKITKNVLIIAMLLFSGIASQQLKAQGNVISVTPDSSILGTTVTLAISGHNTHFTQGTTMLRNSLFVSIVASSMNILNDSSMFATFIIPASTMYLGSYDVYADTSSSPLYGGFTVTSGVMISGYVYDDVNSNCVIDGGDYIFGSGYVIVQPGNFNIPVSVNGYYEVGVPLGTYTATITYVPNYFGNTITCPLSGTDTIHVATSIPMLIPDQNFGVSYSNGCVSIQTWVSTGNMRPCAWHHTSISYSNTTPYSDPNVSITVTYDSFHNIYASSPAWSSHVGNVVTFHVNVPPFSSGYLTVYDTNSCSAVLGTPSCISVMATPSNISCVDSAVSYSHTCMNFSTSYDPNEKVVLSPSTTDISPTDALTYMIGFQNTGNDTAFKVVVLDTLSSNLNPATLIPVPSDHPYTYSLVAGNVAMFTFNNINLPDSTTSPVNSHGFITYTIQQNPNNQPGTQIYNTGNIYFDYNANVRTNTTFNQIPTTVGINEIVTKDGISVYPNPFTNSTKFVFNNKKGNSKYTLELYDITGKKVREITNITENYYDLNRENLKAEIYFYKVVDNENQIGVGKLIIMN